MAEEELREYERQRMEEIRQLDMEELQIEEYSASGSSSSSSDDDADNDLLLINVHDGSVSTSEFTFNTSLASMHTYLGEVDDAHGRLSIFEGGKIVKLPMFYLQGVILFPGATLPLKIVEDRFISSFLKALNQDEAPCTIGVIRVVGNYYDSRLKVAGVGTTAQIKQYRRLNDGSINVVARGQQRFKLLRRFTDENSAPCAEVQIIEEETPTKTPKEAFAKLGSFSNPNPNPNPSASSSKGNKNKCLFGSSPCSCSGYEKTTDVFDFDESSDEELGLGLNERQNKKRCGACRTGLNIPLTFWPKWVYEMFDSYTLARRAADLWNEIIIKPNLDSLAKNPVLLSFCIASKLPLSESKRQELLEMDGVSYRLKREIQLMRDLNHVRCKSCLTLIAKRSDMVTMSNDGPLNAYVNQHGYVHEVITVHNANGLALQGRPVKEHTWFPGYAWTITNCGMCGSNMGWLFTAVKKDLLPKSFWGIRSSQVADDTVLDQREE